MVLFQGSSFSFGTSGNPSGSSPLSKTLSTPSLGQTQASTSTTPLFGSQTSAPSTCFGMVPNPSFGGTSAPAPQTTMFGGGHVGQQQPSMFPSSTNTMMTQYQPATGQQMTDDSAVRDLQNIKDSYTTGNTRFQYLFLNVVKDPAARVKPRDIDELQWREALRRAGGPDNPHNLWPVPYNGFKGLLDRKASQNDAVKEHRERIDSLQKSVAAMVNRHETVVRVQIEAIKSRHQELSQQLLTTLRHIDSLEARFSRAVGYDTSTPRKVLQTLDEEIRRMESVIASNSAQGLLGRVDSVASAARVQAGTNFGSILGADIDKESLSQAFMILKDYSDAIEKMNNAIHRNARDIEVIKEQSKDA
jgi:hypothetical protein